MKLPSSLEMVAKAPMCFTKTGTYDEVVALLVGFNLASDNGFLVGFEEWLTVELDGWDSQAWTARVLKVAVMRGTLPTVEVGDVEWHKAAIRSLFEILDDFLSVRGSRFGLRRIFVNYEKWARQQSWYRGSEDESLWL